VKAIGVVRQQQQWLYCLFARVSTSLYWQQKASVWVVMG
jgi:hypothetical protein